MATRVPKMDKNRRGFMAVAFAAIVIVGSLTGAQLKEDKQKADSIKKFRQITPTEQIAMLETRKEALAKDRAEWQRKMDMFHTRVRRREAEKRKREEEEEEEEQKKRGGNAA